MLTVISMACCLVGIGTSNYWLHCVGFLVYVVTLRNLSGLSRSYEDLVAELND
jgi:hypothetical protein